MRSINRLLLVLPILIMACAQQSGSENQELKGSSVSVPDRSGYNTKDSLGFTSHGTRYDLIVLKSAREDDEIARSSWEGVRPLLLFSYDATGERSLVLRNDSAVLCLTCGGIFGDPYEGFEFLSDTLILRHYGGSAWRWAIAHTFVRGASGDWPLVMRKDVSYSVFEPDSTMEVRTKVPSKPSTLGSVSAYWE